MAARMPGSQTRSRVLTQQEKRVVDLLANEAMTNKEIAAALRISEETVKRHLSNIMDKTGYSTRLELGVRTLQERVRAHNHCACVHVRAQHPRAFERKIPASRELPAEFHVYSGAPGNLCLGRSTESFAAAWLAAANAASANLPSTQ